MAYSASCCQLFNEGCVCFQSAARRIRSSGQRHSAVKLYTHHVTWKLLTLHFVTLISSENIIIIRIVVNIITNRCNTINVVLLQHAALVKWKWNKTVVFHSPKMKQKQSPVTTSDKLFVSACRHTFKYVDNYANSKTVSARFVRSEPGIQNDNGNMRWLLSSCVMAIYQHSWDEDQDRR